MPDNFVVALDVDDVLLDFDAHWITCAEETLQRPIFQVDNTYPLSSRFGTTVDETKLIWEIFIADRWMSTIPAYPTSAKMIDDLREMGASLWAVSSLHTTSHKERCESLRDLIPAERVICIGYQDTHPDKAPMLQKIGAQVLLDDLPINVKGAQAVMEYPVLLDQHYDGFDHYDMQYTVQTHAEFVKFCREIVLPSIALGR
jgi:hypothetical protein